MIYYLARRKLNYGPAEWDALPWHHQRMFLEGFHKEADPEGEESGNGPETDGMEDDDALGEALKGAKHRRAERNGGT